MTEPTVDDSSNTGEEPSAAPAAPASPPAATAGSLLRAARERTGLHIAALAVSLKVPVRKLEALEADRYHQLTDAVFTRALASSVCRALKLDPAPIMALLPKSETPRLGADAEGLNAPFRGSERQAAAGVTAALGRPAFIAAAVLVVAAGVLLLVPGPRPDSGREPARPDPVAAVPAPAPEPPPAMQQPVEAASPAASAPTAALAAADRPAPAQPAAPAAAPASTVTAPATLVAASGLRGSVLFRTTGPSWIEVVDATGSVSLRRVVGPNEQTEVAGPTPLRITVGSASVTRVEVRGQPMDLSTVTRDNVARFEVQ